MKKLFIYNQPFNYYTLKNTELATKLNNIENLDDNDLLMIVSDIEYKDFRFNIKEFKTIRNKKYFMNKVELGSILDNSKFYEGNKKFFIFKLNPIEYKLTSRQKHGFIYEMQIKDLNNLKILPNIAKWDAYGNLDKEFIQKRLDESKNIEVFDGNSSIIIDNDNLDELFDYNNGYFNKFKDDIHWSIKCMGIKTDVELGDFKRIAGLYVNQDGLVLQRESDIEKFFLVVSFHDKSTSKTIMSEYIVFMGTNEWIKYLPKTLFELHDGNFLYNEMYSELKEHRLIGNRTKETEYRWNLFTQKYRKLTENSIIKLRFKRDTEGQLRIQSAISYNNFINIVLKSPHIKIY